MSIALAVVALSVLVLIAYAGNLNNGFVWDDNQQIVMNPDLQPGAPWSHLFAADVWGYKHRDQPGHTNYYRPFQMVAYRLTADWFGLEPQYLHALSLIFALAAVLAAFTVYLKLIRSLAVAFAAAALFTVHPVHSEAVDWISALPELGCATFVLISFGLFLSARNPDPTPTLRFPPRRWALFALSLLAFAAALLWKETATVLPVIIAACVLCMESGNVRERLLSSLKLSAPFWCVLAAYLVLRFRMLGSLAVRQRIWDLTPPQVVLNAFHLMTLYWWKLLAPLHLNAYHAFSPVRSIADPRSIIGIVFVALSCVAIGYAFVRTPLIAFAALWVFITLLPVMNIYALGRNVFAERYLYLPSVGFCLLVAVVAASAVKRLPENVRKPLSALLLVAVVTWFSWETFDRNPDWHDDATLFRKTLDVSPEAPFVHFMVAATEGDGQNPAESQSAEAHYLQAIALARDENPPDSLDLARSYEGLASLYSDRGDYAHALQVLHQWRDAVPSDPELDVEEGLVLLKSGRWQEAEPLLNRAFAARPQNENVLNALGLLAWEHKRNLAAAESYFTRALAIHTAKDDFQASLHNNLGGVYGDLQQFSLALDQFQSAVAISPDDAEYHTNLAVALAELNRYEEAAAEIKIALRIAPDYPPARAVLDQLQRH